MFSRQGEIMSYALIRKSAAIAFAFVIATFMAFAITGIDQAQAASKKSVYVVKSITTKTAYGSIKTTHSYNSKGLLTKRKGDDKTLQKYKYKGKKLMTFWADGGNGAPTNLSYKYKNGKLKSNTDTLNGISHKFKLNSKGKVKKMTTAWSSTSSSSTTYKYNGKGYLKSYKYSTWKNIAEKYSYDSKGNVKKSTSYMNDNPSQSTVTTYKNTYKSGRLVKVVKKDEYGNKTTAKITYKKIKVPSSYKKLVKKQQKNILQMYASGVGAYGIPLGYF